METMLIVAGLVVLGTGVGFVVLVLKLIASGAPTNTNH